MVSCSRHDAANVTGNRRMLAFALGYFVNDIVATMPDWVSHPQVSGTGQITATPSPHLMYRTTVPFTTSRVHDHRTCCTMCVASGSSSAP